MFIFSDGVLHPVDRVHVISDFHIEVQTYPILGKKEGTAAILLGFEPEFEGDRVFAMMYGLNTIALIVSSRTGRLIKQAVHITGMAFLPI